MRYVKYGAKCDAEEKGQGQLQPAARGTRTLNQKELARSSLIGLPRGGTRILHEGQSSGIAPAHNGSEKRSFFRTLGRSQFSPLNRLLAVRNTRFEKQSSIYSSQMSKLNSVESPKEGENESWLCPR
jgi:hypothetical protein